MITKHALVTMTSSNTAYSFAIPANATNLKFQCRELTETILYSWDNFTNYFTVPIPAAGAAANNTGVVAMGPTWRCSPNGQTIYFKDAANSGKHIEIEYAIDG